MEINLSSKIQLQIARTAEVSAVLRWRIIQQKMTGREVALLIALRDQALGKIISSHLGPGNDSLCNFGQTT